jgi:hypothetical protein
MLRRDWGGIGYLILARLQRNGLTRSRGFRGSERIVCIVDMGLDREMDHGYAIDVVHISDRQFEFGQRH